MRLARSIVFAILLLVRPLSAEAPITLKIYPAISAAPATIRVTVLVPRDPASRQVCVVIDGENYYRSSCFELVGKDAPYQTLIYYPDLPAGHYTAMAELTRETLAGRTTARSVPYAFRVVGFGEEPEPDEP